MKKIVLTIVSLLSVISLLADKAYPFPVEVSQSDGTTLNVILHGDEDFHYYTTVDGVLLVRQDDGYYYVGAVDSLGRLTATSQLAHNEGERKQQEILLAKAQQLDVFLEAGQTESLARKVRREPIDDSGGVLFFHEGSPKALVILVEFNDLAFSIDDPKRSFEDYFNAMSPLPDYGNGEHQNVSSVRKYFNDMSFGRFSPVFDVYGPVTLPNPLQTYGGST